VTAEVSQKQEKERVDASRRAKMTEAISLSKDGSEQLK
jgi:hypothetical protein